MKSFFKRSAIGLAILGMSGSVFAMSMPNGYFIGVEGLRLRPMNGDLDYLVTTITSGSNTFRDQDAISTDFSWDWRVFGGMRFGDNDDITVSWLRMRASDSEAANLTSVTNSVRYLDTSFNFANAKATFDLDEVYGVLGHTIYFNNPWSMRFAAGLEYARIDSDFNTYGRDTSEGAVVQQGLSESELRGWGPRGEFDVTYHLPSNFALFANSNAALLVSDRELWMDHTAFSESTTTNNTLLYNRFSDRHVVVPKFGMRLGASYTWLFGQAGAEGAMSSFVLSAGWQVESYIHAIERPSFDDNVANTSAPSSGEGIHTKVSNFGDHGLFLGVTFNG